MKVGDVRKIKGSHGKYLRLIEELDAGWKTVECDREGRQNGGIRFITFERLEEETWT